MRRQLVSIVTAVSVSISALAPAPLAIAAEASVYEQCRELAADPFDPKTAGQGFALAAINSPLAIEKCEAARKRAPDDMELLYWTFRAHLSAGVETDEQLVDVMTDYIALRDNDAHELALYSMFEHDDEIYDAVRRHAKTIKDRFYWCEREFCGSRLSDDYVALFPKPRERYYFAQYARQGYLPALIRSLNACSLAILNGAPAANDIERNLLQRAHAGDRDALFAFAVAFARHTVVEPDATTKASQVCVSSRVSQEAIERYILPELERYSNQPPLFEDYGGLIAALEDDGAMTGPFRHYAAMLEAIGTRLAGQQDLTADDRELLIRLADPAVEDFYKRRDIWARALNIIALLEFNGIWGAGDKQTAVRKWWEIAQENSYYSSAAVFNLLSNQGVLSEEQKQFLLFEFDPYNMGYDERVAYATYLIAQPDFENVHGNPYNQRATRIIFSYIGADQLHGSLRAPPNGNEAEKMFEFLSAETIAREQVQTAIFIGSIIAGLAIIGSFAGDSAGSTTTPSGQVDRCLGLDGLGWIDNHAGNAAAMFGGCSKY